MSKKIYVLVAYSSDGRLYDLGYSPSLKEVRKAVNSEEVKEQLKNIKPQPKVEERVVAVRIRKYNFKTKRYDIIESDWKAPKEEKGK